MDVSHPLAEDLEHILDHTEAIWPRLRGERLFLTGGTGFIGTWLLETLTWASDRLHLGLEITALSRDPAAFARRHPRLAAHPAIRFHQGDVRDFSFPPGTHSQVIHGAAETSTAAAETPRLLADTILLGTRRVLEFAEAARATNVLLLSSGAVYGRQPSDLPLMNEAFGGAPPTHEPGSAYGGAKRAAELLGALASLEGGPPAKIARLFAFVGPHLPLDAHFAIGNFLRDAAAGTPLVVKGDGTPFRSYLYAADLTAWLFRILLDGRPCRPYNVGSDQAITISDLARLVTRTVAPGLDVRILGTPTGAPPERYVPSIERVRCELHLEPWISLEEALIRTFRWIRTDHSLQGVP